MPYAGKTGCANILARARASHPGFPGQSRVFLRPVGQRNITGVTGMVAVVCSVRFGPHFQYFPTCQVRIVRFYQRCSRAQLAPLALAHSASYRLQCAAPDLDPIYASPRIPESSGQPGPRPYIRQIQNAAGAPKPRQRHAPVGSSGPQLYIHHIYIYIDAR